MFSGRKSFRTTDKEGKFEGTNEKNFCGIFLKTNSHIRNTFTTESRLSQKFFFSM